MPRPLLSTPFAVAAAEETALGSPSKTSISAVASAAIGTASSSSATRVSEVVCEDSADEGETTTWILPSETEAVWHEKF